MANKNEIFSRKNPFKNAAIVANYLWKYIRKKPVIFNLNFNVTNICNQNCAMCNAMVPGQPNAKSVTFDNFKKYIDIFVKHKVASLTISGGEPSIVPDIEKMLDYAAGKFPFGVNVNSNLFANEKIITRFATTCLKHNYRIGMSFDGFGETVDTLRGAKNVSERLIKSIELVTKLKEELGSKSALNLHTVISDKTVEMVPKILDLSEKYGWTQSLAPVNNFLYQKPIDPLAPLLHHSEKLEEVIKYALTKKNIVISKDFLTSIPKFTQGKTPKLCPYLTGLFKTNKVFLDPNGDLSLCFRNPLGNINNQSINEIFSSNEYKKEAKSYHSCEGCWMVCYVEILLAMPKFYQKRVIKKLNKNLFK